MVEKKFFEKLSDGRDVYSVSLKGKGGLEVVVLNYGATVKNIFFGGKDICLGFDKIEGYEKNLGGYQGATVGRYANRIAKGKFSLNGVEYDIGCNDGGKAHLHGGFVGFNQKIWDCEILEEETPKVRFSCEAADGEMGYPGNMKISVEFTVADDNALNLRYNATTDKDTIVNLTNHTYFNPNGFDGGNATTLNVQINSDKIIAADDCLIPCGFMDVEGTPFDFIKMTKVEDRFNSDHQQIKLVGGGIDHNYVLGMTREFRHAATLKSDETGIEIKCFTDLPGVQIYTSNFLGCDMGKGGVNLYKHQGICMETQFFPDSPNNPEYPSCVLKAGETFESVTEYRFDIENK